MPNSEKKLEEIYRLTKQNNKMLRSMKRWAFWGTIFKILLYALFLGIPLYLYFTVLQPVLNDTAAAFQQVQGTGAGAFLQLQELGSLLNNFPGVDFSGTSQ